MELSEENKGVIKERINAPGVLLTMQLKCKNTGIVVTVGNIHVTWGWFKLPDQQSIQVKINYSSFYIFFFGFPC